MIKKVLLVLVVALAFTITVNAQGITFGGQLGWAIPGGDAFEDGNGDKMSSGGLSIDADIMYVLPIMEGKLAAGIMYNSSFLFGSSDSDLDIGMYGLDLYGIKGYYRFFNSKVTPYASLGLGLSQLKTPEITYSSGGTSETTGGEKASSFGIHPEVGLNLGGFILSCSYFVPMKYTFDDMGDGISAGALKISLGFRKTIEF